MESVLVLVLLLMFSLLVGQNAPSMCLQMIQNWREWLISQIFVLPFREMLTNQRKLANRNIMGKKKCEVLQLGKTPMLHSTLGADQLESSFVEKCLGIVVDNK